MPDEEIILNTDDRAAKLVTVTGWVSRTGIFYGEDERIARFAGCTHILCRDCSKPCEKGWLICGDCRAADTDKKYAALERKPWDGVCLLGVFDGDQYFSDPDEAEEWAKDNDTTLEALQLVLCEPHYAEQIEPGEHYVNDLPEDGEVPQEIEEAFHVLNEAIKACRVPLCWYPTKFALELQAQ